jgi:hypothetical protein
MAGKKSIKEVPEHIEKFLKNKEKVRKLIETTDYHHRFGYEHAVGKHLMGADGLLDYDRLKDSEVQRQFADTMADFYLDRALNYFGITKEGQPATDEIKRDTFKSDMLLRAYANTTQSQLRSLTSAYKENFKYEVFGQAKADWLEKIAKNLVDASASHFKKEHIDDIIEYTKAQDSVDKDYLQLEQAIKLLSNYHDLGALPNQEKLANIVGEYAVKKKEKKKAS